MSLICGISMLLGGKCTHAGKGLFSCHDMPMEWRVETKDRCQCSYDLLFLLIRQNTRKFLLKCISTGSLKLMGTRVFSVGLSFDGWFAFMGENCL